MRENMNASVVCSVGSTAAAVTAIAATEDQYSSDKCWMNAAGNKLAMKVLLVAIARTSVAKFFRAADLFSDVFLDVWLALPSVGDLTLADYFVLLFPPARRARSR
jgi:hypothetical protein